MVGAHGTPEAEGIGSQVKGQTSLHRENLERKGVGRRRERRRLRMLEGLYVPVFVLHIHPGPQTQEVAGMIPV